jgi:hypothetical protein
MCTFYISKKRFFMKKNIVIIITCLSTVFAHGMEIIPENTIISWSTIANKTIINLNQGPISSIHNKVDLIICSKVQQQVLPISDEKKCNKNKRIYKFSPNNLITFYFNVLGEGFNASKKSIALQALGTEVNFLNQNPATFTVATILQFIKYFPTAYNRIELFVEKPSDFKLYKTLLEQYVNLINVSSI